MNWIVTPYAVAMWVSTLVGLTVSLLIWRRRHMPGGGALSLLLLALSVGTFFTGFEAAAIGTDRKIVFTQLSYFGTVAAPTLFLRFALVYTGYGAWWLKPRRQWILWVIPVLTLALALTNTLHGLVWSGFTPGPDPAANVVIYDHGVWYFIAHVYFYACVGAAMLALTAQAVSTRDLYRRQDVVVLGAVALPWVANILYVIGVGPARGQDLSLVAMAASAVVLAVIYVRFNFLELLPIAQRALIEQMPDGVLVLDAGNRILEYNPAVLAYTGKRLSSLVGKKADQVFDTCPALVEACQLTENGRSHVRISTDPLSYAEVRRSALANRAGYVRAWLLVVRDITAQRLAERELHGANLELAQRLQELEFRNQELDAFAHTVAHDLRTPLGLIAGYCELLGCGEPQSLDEAETQQALQAMTWACGKMDSIINSLLLLARVRDTEIVAKPLNMESLIREVISRLKREIEERQASVEFDGSEAWPVALGHAPWIEEVWANYVLNAIAYGGNPPIIELGATRLKGSTIRFWVRDNGQGVREDVQPLLFAPFERLGRTHGAGFGLGLSIVRRIVERLGGEVEVQSRPGKGSIFSFTLPEYEEPPSESDEASMTAGGGSEEPARLTDVPVPL